MEGKSYFTARSPGSRLSCCQLGKERSRATTDLPPGQTIRLSSHENSMSAQTKSISYNRLDGCRGHQAWLDSGNTSIGWSVGDCWNLSISIDQQTTKEAPHPNTLLNDVASNTF